MVDATSALTHGVQPGMMQLIATSLSSERCATLGRGPETSALASKSHAPEHYESTCGRVRTDLPYPARAAPAAKPAAKTLQLTLVVCVVSVPASRSLEGGRKVDFL